MYLWTEIWYRSLLLLLLRRLQDLKGTQQTLVHAHHGAGIVKLSAIVGRAEQRNELPFREEFISILHNLMRAADQVHVVLLQEARYHVGSKCKGDATVVFTPSGNVLVWVRPQQIAKESTIGNLLQA